MKAKEVRELSVNELETKLKDLKAELFKLYPSVGFMTEEEDKHTLKNATFILRRFNIEFVAFSLTSPLDVILFI